MFANMNPYFREILSVLSRQGDRAEAKVKSEAAAANMSVSKWIRRVLEDRVAGTLRLAPATAYAGTDLMQLHRGRRHPCVHALRGAPVAGDLSRGGREMAPRRPTGRWDAGARQQPGTARSESHTCEVATRQSPEIRAGAHKCAIPTRGSRKSLRASGRWVK